MNEKKDEFKEWIVSKFDEEAEQELRRLQEKEDQLEVPEGVKEAVFARLQEQLKERSAGEPQTEEDKEDIINQLSPEDREALELGRKMLKAEIGSDKSETKTKRYRKKPMKIYLALAAVIICVLAVGITSVGSPERVVRMVRQAVGDREVEQLDSSDENKIIEGEDEEEAYEEIAKKLQTEPVRIISVLNGMKFEKMIYDEENQVAEMIYKYKKRKVIYFINASYKNSSFGVDIEEKKLQTYKTNVNGYTIKIKEYETKENGKNKYIASFGKDGIEYFLIATMKPDEFEKILNNLFFSE